MLASSWLPENYLEQCREALVDKPVHWINDLCVLVAPQMLLPE